MTVDLFIDEVKKIGLKHDYLIYRTSNNDGDLLFIAIAIKEKNNKNSMIKEITKLTKDTKFYLEYEKINVSVINNY